MARQEDSSASLGVVDVLGRRLLARYAVAEPGVPSGLGPRVAARRRPKRLAATTRLVPRRAAPAAAPLGGPGRELPPLSLPGGISPESAAWMMGYTTFEDGGFVPLPFGAEAGAGLPASAVSSSPPPSAAVAGPAFPPVAFARRAKLQRTGPVRRGRISEADVETDGRSSRVGRTETTGDGPPPTGRAVDRAAVPPETEPPPPDVAPQPTGVPPADEPPARQAPRRPSRHAASSRDDAMPVATRPPAAAGPRATGASASEAPVRRRLVRRPLAEPGAPAPRPRARVAEPGAAAPSTAAEPPAHDAAAAPSIAAKAAAQRPRRARRGLGGA